MEVGTIQLIEKDKREKILPEASQPLYYIMLQAHGNLHIFSTS